MILAIDPGTTESALVWYDGTRPIEAFVCENSISLEELPANSPSAVVCEMLACYGNPVGKETFETAYHIGRIMAACDAEGLPFHRVYRSEVKLHLCGTMRAKDANVRQALLDKFGGSRQAACGTKKAPGPLHGIKSHCWSALAVAVCFAETRLLTISDANLGGGE